MQFSIINTEGFKNKINSNPFNINIIILFRVNIRVKVILSIHNIAYYNIK